MVERINPKNPPEERDDVLRLVVFVVFADFDRVVFEAGPEARSRGSARSSSSLPRPDFDSKEGSIRLPERDLLAMPLIFPLRRHHTHLRLRR
jgi:hypothetical protein